MFNIGFGELAIICIVLIIAVGPERLPSMMKTLGKTIRTLRQASRDIRASTGIDELMREDFDLYAPVKNPPRRPAPMPAPVEPAALPADSSVAAASEPKPVSRQEIIDMDADAAEAAAAVPAEVDAGDRPSVVVAPPPQSVGLRSDNAAGSGLPSDEPTPIAPPAAAAPAVTAADSGTSLPADAPAPPATPIASNVDTLPRAPIVQPASSPAAEPQPQPKAADAKPEGSGPSEPKQSGA